MKFTPTLSRNLILVLLLLTFGLSEAQINTPSGAVVPFGANKTYAYGILPTNLPSGGTYGQAQDAANAYNTWRSFYVEDCGGSPKKYRVKFDDPNKTVSEGIAYGMLLAAYAADKPLFDGLWAYFNQFTTNGLMSWRVDGCNGANQQSGSASDSDFDAAFALLVAKNQWPTGTTYNGNTYNTEANAIIAKIRKTDGTGDMASDGQAINGNTWGSSDSRRNPSYQSPAYYREYATQVSDNFWSTTAVNGAYTLLNNNISQGGGGKGLVSDWSYNTGALTTFNGGTGYTPTLGYGYDACRNPMRMAQDVIWNNNSNATAILASMAAYLNSRGVNNVGGPLNPNGTNYAGYSQNATFYSTFAMGLVGSNSTYQSLLNQFYSKVVSTTDVMQNQSLSGYFGNTLRVLSLFMMTGNMWKIGTTSLQDINVKVNGVDVPSNTVYDFQNVQTGTGKSITFVIENKGFASLALTATPKVAISGSTNYVVNQSSVSSPLALGGTTNFSVTLTPNTAGTRTAVITIANNDPDASESTYTITLTGIGTQFATSPNILVKQGSTTFSNGSSYSMGNATQAATSTQTFQVINTGDAPLNISSISVTGATFALSGTAPTVVAVGGTANFNVSFTPAAATTYNGTVRISSNDASDPLFIINVSGVGVACPSSSVTNVIQDWDANSNLVATWTSSVGYAITATTNPAIGVLNTSPTVLLKRRNPTVAANSYSDGFRFNLCGSTVNALNMTGKGTISMLVYSSAANIPITMALDNNASLSPPYANVASNIQYTTKVNQWERLYFDLSGATGNTNVRYITFQINPTAVDAGTYYFDDIRYDVPLCPSLTSSITSTGVFHDFDNLKNISLQYVYGAQVSTSGVSLNQFATNPSVGSTNTSSGVAQYIRGVDGQYSTSGFNFLLCTGVPFPNSASKVISMLVYSPKVGAKVQINAYNGATSYSSVAQTTLANQWEKLYFNFTNYTALTSVTQLEFFFDASAVSVPSAANRTYYFDQVQFDSNPCVTGIPTTGIFNDYDFNRYVNLAFQPIGTINEAAANPSAIGINTSSGVAQYTRPSAATQYDIIRYSACQGAF
ncbi:MAG: choice-of-anchor D domain-containing protein, partial [Cytophagales bacterium]|nr:choice-of-anchor D domain-containing protein [Cytophagales bacterium]